MINHVPVVILCGGRGVLVEGSANRLNKSLIEIAGKPIISHVVGHYLRHGFRRFIFALGQQGGHVQDRITRAFPQVEANWGANFSFVETGPDTSTGDRIKRCKDLIIDGEYFAVHYSDTLSDLNLTEYFSFFKQSGRLASMVGARLPTRFKVLGLRPGETLVRDFADQPVISQEFVNGGYYFFSSKVLSEEFFPSDASVVLENDMLGKLAKKEQLDCFVHRAGWHPYDSERDVRALEMIVSRNG